MSPLDRELERALSARAADLVPPPDLLSGVEREARGLRRRRGVLTGAAALSVLAIAVAVPLAIRDSSPSARSGFVATQEPSPSASPSALTPPPTEPTLGWAKRGPLSSPDELRLPDRIQDTLNREPDLPPSHAWSLLWAAPLPDGRVAAAIEHWSSPAYTTFYVEEADGSGGRLLHRREITNLRTWQVSAYVDGVENYVVVVGAPTTGQIEFAADGRTYAGVKTAHGVAIVDVTKGGDRTAYRIRLHDSDGAVVYEGPIDLLSED